MSVKLHLSVILFIIVNFISSSHNNCATVRRVSPRVHHLLTMQNFLSHLQLILNGEFQWPQTSTYHAVHLSSKLHLQSELFVCDLSKKVSFLLSRANYSAFSILAVIFLDQTNGSYFASNVMRPSIVAKVSLSFRLTNLFNLPSYERHCKVLGIHLLIVRRDITFFL